MFEDYLHIYFKLNQWSLLKSALKFCIETIHKLLKLMLKWDLIQNRCSTTPTNPLPDNCLRFIC